MGGYNGTNWGTVASDANPSPAIWFSWGGNQGAQYYVANPADTNPQNSIGSLLTVNRGMAVANGTVWYNFQIISQIPILGSVDPSTGQQTVLPIQFGLDGGNF